MSLDAGAAIDASMIPSPERTQNTGPLLQHRGLVRAGRALVRAQSDKTGCKTRRLTPVAADSTTPPRSRTLEFVTVHLVTPSFWTQTQRRFAALRRPPRRLS